MPGFFKMRHKKHNLNNIKQQIKELTRKKETPVVNCIFCIRSFIFFYFFIKRGDFEEIFLFKIVKGRLNILFKGEQKSQVLSNLQS